jgi:hypothetical protein
MGPADLGGAAVWLLSSDLHGGSAAEKCFREREVRSLSSVPISGSKNQRVYFKAEPLYIRRLDQVALSAAVHCGLFISLISSRRKKHDGSFLVELAKLLAELDA